MAPKTFALLQATFLLLLVVLLSCPHTIQSKPTRQSFIQCSDGFLSSNGQDVSELKCKEFGYNDSGHSGVNKDEFADLLDSWESNSYLKSTIIFGSLLIFIPILI
ncbi:hypothetical protein SLA2020_263130 [Shorea laevis]